MSQNQKETAAEKAKREEAEAKQGKEPTEAERKAAEEKELADMEEREKREAAAAEKAKAARRAPYTVARGCSLCGTRKGMLDEGDEVRAEYLAGGEQALTRLVDKGIVDANR